MATTTKYEITALQMTIYYNVEGDHDHNGLLFALSDNVPILEYLRARAERTPPPNLQELYSKAKTRADILQVKLPLSIEDARKPHPLVRPLVLRACRGDIVEVKLRNDISDRWVGPHLVGPGYDVKTDDGSDVGMNNHSLVKPRGTRTYTWLCENEGVFPFHDGGNYSGGEDGTNVHGLFGALVVEPKGSIWRDPVTGRRSRRANGTFRQLDGLYLDILPPGDAQKPDVTTSSTTLPTHPWPDPVAYPNFDNDKHPMVGHREFVIFFHDEPEFLPPHGELAEDPCEHHAGGGHGGGGGHEGGQHDLLPIMPISYRAEPMINRERKLWELEANGHIFEKPVLNEEQHHSSWMFGDPVTPILKAYIGDPVRIRLVHAGVKETHVFHLHLYEWHAVPEATDYALQTNSSPRIDAISISPQTGHTIEPVWGAGNRHQVAGDVIFHCHLYPHFHEGMWGMFRTFETLQSGKDGARLAAGGVYAGRRIGRYPDNTRIERLLPLPDRPLPPPKPTATHPGFPLYIPGKNKQKSPVPPWPDREYNEGEKEFCDFKSLKATSMPTEFDYRPIPTDLERNAFNKAPLPAELFTRNPLRKQQSENWTGDYSDEDRERCRDVIVEKQRIDYNGYGWHDKDGHLYYLAEEGNPNSRRKPKEPLFFRAWHEQILNLTLDNKTPREIAKTEFDLAFPPCPKRKWLGECALHVHMVKFDPICGDGASVGWNYLSGPQIGKRMFYRWWLDQEFGTIFFHDHLFANYRQKHGLFGALIVEPKGAEFFDNINGERIISGLQARVMLKTPHPSNGNKWFREFCIGIGDFIPMWNRNGNPLNPPAQPGGHGDQGVMALNYRSDPIPERLKDPTDPTGQRDVDPAYWFSSLDPYNRDPYTTIFQTNEGDPLWFRMIQGSHEEQHSFQIHGMRWQRFRDQKDSALRNQQTFGIAEAFTFINNEPYGRGDYLYKLSSSDDLWLGCWGLIRVARRGTHILEKEIASFPEESESSSVPRETPPPVSKMRRFHVVVEAKRLVYREPDLVDPFGLIYRLVSFTPPDGIEQPISESDTNGSPEPLILRCREGEWVQVTLENKLPPGFRPEPEPFAPEVPVEERNPFSHRPERPVSTQVSMHADLVLYDVLTSDGANVGRNPLQTVKLPPPKKPVTYTWHAYRPPGTNANEPLGPVLLQDMADFRNHRHHGLIGALIVEDKNATPFSVEPGKPTATGSEEMWYGSRATVVVKPPGKPEDRFEEAVLLLQDGLRLYLNGIIHFPIADAPPGVGEDETDVEDQGQKGFNYRTEPVGAMIDPSYNPNNSDNIAPSEWPNNGNPHGDWLSNPSPATPLFIVPVDSKVRLHLVGGCDKPRNHSFTVHGVSWPEWRFLSQGDRRPVSSESAITTGTARVFEFTPQHAGDHAYRSGVLKWAVPQGLWGIIRVMGSGVDEHDIQTPKKEGKARSKKSP